MADENKKKQYTVLHQRYASGPHGLGDPDDVFLRKVEKDILIPKIVRDRARQEKCVPEVKAFTECGVNSKLAMVFTCQKENSKLKECLTKWYQDEKFWEECKQQYLQERSDFRRTGEPKKIRQFRARAANYI